MRSPLSGQNLIWIVLPGARKGVGKFADRRVLAKERATIAGQARYDLLAGQSTRSWSGDQRRRETMRAVASHFGAATPFPAGLIVGRPLMISNAC